MKNEIKMIKVTTPQGVELFYRNFSFACQRHDLSYSYLKKLKRPFLSKGFLFEDEILIKGTLKNKPK